LDSDLGPGKRLGLEKMQKHEPSCELGPADGDLLMRQFILLIVIPLITQSKIIRASQSAFQLGFSGLKPSMSVVLPRVIGHRGAKAIAPENTLAAIRAAKRVGATFVEVDVMLSKDKVFLCAVFDDMLQTDRDKI
jgi:hypothetical protein